MSIPNPPSSFPPTAFQPEPLLAVACPTCFGAIAVGTDVLGQAAECPLCGRGFHVPMPVVADASRTPTPATPPAGRPASEASDRSRKQRRDEMPVSATSPPSARPTNDSPPAAPEPAAAPNAELQFEEPVRMVGSGDKVIVLRRLSPEEKAVRRARRNLIMMMTGVSILMAIVLLLGTKRTRHRG